MIVDCLQGYDLCSNNNDNFIDTLSQSYWKVTLNNEQEILQDDGRPGLTVSNAWVRLNLMLQAHPKLHITGLSIHFRDNTYTFPANCAAYYFSKGALQGVGSPESLHYYVVGYLENANDHSLYCEWIKVPELICINKYTRPLSECAPPMLISRLTERVSK